MGNGKGDQTHVVQATVGTIYRSQIKQQQGARVDAATATVTELRTIRAQYCNGDASRKCSLTVRAEDYMGRLHEQFVCSKLGCASTLH